MFLQNIRIIQGVFKRFFDSFDKKTVGAITTAQERDDSDSVVTPEFLAVFGIFFDNPGRWFSVFDIMSKTQLRWAAAYSILIQMANAGWINPWVFDIARHEFTLANPDDADTENKKCEEKEDTFMTNQS